MHVNKYLLCLHVTLLCLQLTLLCRRRCLNKFLGHRSRGRFSSLRPPHPQTPDHQEMQLQDQTLEMQLQDQTHQWVNQTPPQSRVQLGTITLALGP